jgi:hypothetical protein
MAAELVQDEDPNDPEMILRDLPEQERPQFLRQYHEAVDAAHDLAGYRSLRRLLHAWRLTAIATKTDGYYEELDAVRSGSAQTVPAEDAIPGWHERLAAVRARR